MGRRVITKNVDNDGSERGSLRCALQATCIIVGSEVGRELTINLFEKPCARVGRDFFTNSKMAIRPIINNSTTTPLDYKKSRSN
jgi:hypothetical protein